MRALLFLTLLVALPGIAANVKAAATKKPEASTEDLPPVSAQTNDDHEEEEGYDGVHVKDEEYEDEEVAAPKPEPTRKK